MFIAMAVPSVVYGLLALTIPESPRYLVRLARVAVPEQVSVIGLDDHLMAGAVDLTTVARPVLEEGALAGRLVLDLLADRSREPVDVTVPTRLVIRGTTNPPEPPPAPRSVQPL